ncbi:MAG TPA: cation:proton antiporter [Longimicrobiales bacterium]
MPEAVQEIPEFLQNLALVLCTAAVTTVLFHRLRQPVVFGYLLAGFLVGPNFPAVPFNADEAVVRTLSELGVILLLFSLGLEFSLRTLIRVGPTAGLIAVSQSSAMVWLGYLVGQAFGWTVLESVYAGAAIAISSTTIIIKAFEEQAVKGRFTRLAFGILIVEDLIAIFLLAILTAVSLGSGLSTVALATTAARLAVFLGGLIIVGLLLVPRLIRYLVRLGRPEIVTVTSMGICFAASLLALSLGYSVALGAFIAGALVAESGEEAVVVPLVEPIRDVFAAIFFVAVGMLIDPVLIARHAGAVLALALAVVVGKVVTVSISAFLTGHGVRTSVQTGMSLAQIGEFSFIIVALGLATGATGDFLYPSVVAVSALTTLSTPWLIRASDPVATFVDRKLPKPLQTFVALYGSWVDRLRAARRAGAGRSPVRRLVRLLLLDAALLALLVIGTSLELERISALLSAATGLDVDVARLMVVAGSVLVAVPLVVGTVRTARRLGLRLALRALPATAEGRADFAAAPRRALIVTLQLAILILVGAPLVAITQPFLPPFQGAIVLAVVLAVLALAFWRSATELHGHARAGAEVIVSALAQQMAREEDIRGRRALGHVHAMLPGLGEPVPVHIGPDSPIVGRTLAELNLRGLTGATVLAILRDGQEVLLPRGRDEIRADDVLALAGSAEAVAMAKRLIRTGG